ncbi:MAG TPA: GntR family transcriptional regulator [Anaerolineae bacterium]|nr:GntR family transcriptional regulator [Anaerolineae bacterium]HMR64018.1 GntR family transcriptional regulator [Anaerolineae bacterium]
MVSDLKHDEAIIEIPPRVVLSQHIKEYIIEAILNGKLNPGDRIVETALARQLQVSQAPVREAVRDLVLLGFLESEPYKGTSVRSFAPEELYEVYLVRAALESLAARMAASRLTEADVQTLREVLDEMIEAAQKNDAQRMVRLDNDFHETILQISGNRLLYQLWKTLQFGFWTIVTTRISNYDLEYLARRHEELIEALMTREPDRAAQAMQRHIEDLGKPPETG